MYFLACVLELYSVSGVISQIVFILLIMLNVDIGTVYIIVQMLLTTWKQWFKPVLKVLHHATSNR